MGAADKQVQPTYREHDRCCCSADDNCVSALGGNQACALRFVVGGSEAIGMAVVEISIAVVGSFRGGALCPQSLAAGDRFPYVVPAGQVNGHTQRDRRADCDCQCAADGHQPTQQVIPVVLSRSGEHCG